MRLDGADAASPVGEARACRAFGFDDGGEIVYAPADGIETAGRSA
jgi:hypothetical protein